MSFNNQAYAYPSKAPPTLTVAPFRFTEVTRPKTRVSFSNSAIAWVCLMEPEGISQFYKVACWLLSEFTSLLEHTFNLKHRALFINLYSLWLLFRLAIRDESLNFAIFIFNIWNRNIWYRFAVQRYTLLSRNRPKSIRLLIVSLLPICHEESRQTRPSVSSLFLVCKVGTRAMACCIDLNLIWHQFPIGHCENNSEACLIKSTFY